MSQNKSMAHKLYAFLSIAIGILSFYSLFQNCGQAFKVKSLDNISEQASVNYHTCGNIPHGGQDARTMFIQQTVPIGSTCAQELQTRTCNDGQFSNWTGTYTNISCSVAGVLDCDNTPHAGTETRTMFAQDKVPFGNQCTQENQTRTCNKGRFSKWSGTFVHASCSALPAPTPTPQHKSSTS